MRSCRGPGFADPLALPASRTSKAHAAETGFQPLPRGALEPSAQELASLVNEFYAAGGGGDLGSMGETDAGVVFQGDGDPLEAAAIVLETVRLVAQERNGLSFRLNTLGLCDQETIELLLASEELEREQQGDRRRESRIASVSVFLPSACPSKYDELLAPSSGRGLRDACGFVARLAEAGVNVECSAVARPDVNVAEVETLAMSLGARSFRTRSWVK